MRRSLLGGAVLALLSAACAPPELGVAQHALGAAHVLYLELGGASVVLGGTDDAVAGISELAAAPAYPPFDPAVPAPRVAGADVVAVLVDRVRGYFAPFDLDVTTTKPASGEWAAILVGGTGASLSPAQASGIAGIAPLDCGDANARSLGFAFADSLAPRYGGVVALGAAIAHEAGHGYGLQHVSEPRDPMYSVAVPTQTLDDLFALSFRSGTYSSFVAGGGAPQPERCGLGPTLDDHALLLAALGARPAPTSAPPTIALDVPGDEAVLATTFDVSATATDDVGVSRVEIYANLELVAVAKAPPYAATLSLPPAESVTITVEAVDADGQRARASRTYAVRAPAMDAGADAATPIDAASGMEGAHDEGCAMGPRAARGGASPWIVLAGLALMGARRARRRR